MHNACHYIPIEAGGGHSVSGLSHMSDSEADVCVRAQPGLSVSARTPD